MIRSAATQTTLNASVMISPGIHPVLPRGTSGTVVSEGWLLKKRRKKMQGFARRYFTLDHYGVLSYSFGPGQPARDQVSLYNAAISTAPGRKDIHVDSNTATFHIKCLSTQDFEMWMVAFRKFISGSTEARRSASIRIAARQGSVQISRTGNIVEEMATTIHGLEEACSALLEQIETTMAISRDSSISSSRRAEKDKYKEKFALFKKPHHTDHPNTSTENLQANHANLHQRIRTSIAELKSQHSALSKMYQPANSPRMSPVLDVEEDDKTPVISMSPKLASPIGRHPNRVSRISIAGSSRSDSIHEWYDAMDNGPEEFVMDEHVVPGDHLEQQPSQITVDSTSFLDQQSDRSSINTDIGEELISSEGISGETQIVYRNQLPVNAPEDEGSLFTILKKNVGKDLSTITFPVTFNEPLTLLQRSAEELEYWDLLNQGAQAPDAVTRIAYVAAFAVSGYAHTRHRSGRKGFNPMLGETFEDVRMKLIAEKVRHNPLEMAYHAQGQGWDLTAVSAGRTKFWGKSLEIIPSGFTRVKIGGEEYVWGKPSSFIRNLMVGTKYLEHTGQMTIENVTSGVRCVLDFKQNGYWGPTNVVSGTIHSSDGEVLSKLEGKWDDQMALNLDGDRLHVLWRCAPFPKNSMQQYGFTSFTISLNEITKDIATKLPPTDSRLRPDVRALECGDLDTAEAEKVRIEELQRERRKRGEDTKPRWFKQVGEQWEYLGGYWEARARSWKEESAPSLW